MAAACQDTPEKTPEYGKTDNDYKFCLSARYEYCTIAIVQVPRKRQEKHGAH